MEEEPCIKFSFAASKQSRVESPLPYALSQSMKSGGSGGGSIGSLGKAILKPYASLFRERA